MANLSEGATHQDQGQLDKMTIPGTDRHHQKDHGNLIETSRGERTIGDHLRGTSLTRRITHTGLKKVGQSTETTDPHPRRPSVNREKRQPNEVEDSGFEECANTLGLPMHTVKEAFRAATQSRPKYF